MKRTQQPAKPPFGLLTARKEALTLERASGRYVRRRLDRLRFNLDAAVPWVNKSLGEAREADKPWLLAVASGLVATSQQISYLLTSKAFSGADWEKQARQILVTIDKLLSLYAEATGAAHLGYLDEEPGEARVA